MSPWDDIRSALDEVTAYRGDLISIGGVQKKAVVGSIATDPTMDIHFTRKVKALSLIVSKTDFPEGVARDTKVTYAGEEYTVAARLEESPVRFKYRIERAR